MRYRWIGILIVGILLLFLLVGCGNDLGPEDLKADDQDSTATPMPTPTATPTPEPVWSTMSNANFISRIAQDTSGHIWSVGNGGVVMWDTETGDYQKFTIEQGLPSNVGVDITATIDGAIWLAMSGGISRYAGEQWTTFTEEDGLVNNYPRVLAADPNGGLWAGFIGGVSHFDGAAWTSHTEGLSDSVITQILPTLEGQVWVGSFSKVYLYENGTWTSYEIGAKYVDSLNQERVPPRVVDGLSARIYSITQAPDGSIWFGTDKGGARYRDGEWTYFTKKEGLILSKELWDIAFDGSGVAWGVFHDQGVFRYTSGWWSYLTQDNGLPELHYIYMVESEPGGGVWFGTREYGALLARYPNWTLVSEETGGLGSNEIVDILPLEDGSTWFAHKDAGLSRLRLEDNDLAVFRTDDQIPGNSLTHLAVGEDGTLWIGNPFMRFDGEQWDDFSDNEILMPDEYYPSVFSLEFSDDGTLWLGQSLGKFITLKEENLLISWDGETWRTHGHEGEVIEGKAVAIDFASDGSLWVLVDHFFSKDDPVGVAHYTGEHWESFSAEEGFSSEDPTCLVVDHDDVVWVGTNDAELLRYDGVSWETTTHADGLQGTEIRDLFVDQAGSLWVATDVGALRYDGSTWELFKAEDGLADDVVYDIEQAQDGAMWFATANGPSRFYQGIWQTFTSSDGLGYDLVRDIEIAPDGAVWFLQTSGGLSRYGPPQ